MTLTPAQLDAAAEKWHAHVERLLRLAKAERENGRRCGCIPARKNSERNEIR